MFRSQQKSWSRWLTVIMSTTDNAMKYRDLEMSKYVNFTGTQTAALCWMCWLWSCVHQSHPNIRFLANLLK